MAKVHVIAKFVAREGKESQLRALLQGMLAPTRAELGCEMYELYESDSKGRFFLYEIWENQAALDEHAQAPPFRHLQEAAGEFLQEPFEINIVRKL